MSSFPSKPIFCISVPEPKTLLGHFEYRYFTIDETIDDKGLNSYISEKFETAYGPPRRNVLRFDNIDSLAKDNQIGKNLLIAQGARLFQNDVLQNLTSEILLQNAGFIKFTSEIQDVQTRVLSEKGGEGANAQEAFFAAASNVDDSDFYSDLVSELPNQGPTYINPSTGLPTLAGYDSVPDDAIQTLIASDFAFDLLEASSNDPFSIFSKSQKPPLGQLKRLQSGYRKINNPTSISTEEYFAFVDEIPNFLGLSPLAGIGIIGYVIFKTEIQKDGTRESKEPILIRSISAVESIDPYIKYGTTYEYAIHPLCVFRTGPGDNHVNLLLVGTNSRKVTIESIERVPPPHLQAILFDYDGNNVMLRWKMPIQQNDLGGPIGDIKGYQVFSRPNTSEPFRLIKFIDFNDAIERYELPESIPERLTMKDEFPVNQYYMKITPDQDYIVAMCVIDAHGNSSNLSAQYKIRLISYENRLNVGFASYAGAPKQYPNFMMSDKSFLDSIAISQAKKMSVFYKPQVTHLNIFNTTEQIIPDSTAEELPVYRVQMINIDTQSDNILDINIIKTSEGNN